MDDEKQKTIQEIIDSRRVFFHPEALSKSDSDIKSHFENSIDNVRNGLKDVLKSFPDRLLKVISESDRGNIMIVSPGSLPGFIYGHYNPTENRAYITTKAIMENDGASQEEITHLLDHLLGSRGNGARLSDGHGITKKLEEFGKEIFDLYRDKNNKISDYGDNNPHEFLAQAFRFYITSDPILLKESLPKVYNMINGKWCNNEFWKEVIDEGL